MAISAIMQRKIGKAGKPLTMEIDKSQIRRFATALGEENPIHFDEAAAKAAGFSSLVGPPTFGAAIIHLDSLLEELEVNQNATMHYEEEYEYFRPICAGDVLQITHRLVDAYDKDAGAGRIIFMIFETRANDAKGRPVLKARRTMVEQKR